MADSLYALLPAVALAAFLLSTVLIAAGRTGGSRAGWMVPAGLAAVFALWSLHAVSSEGLAGVWHEHTRNAWGNQIWFDLLLAIGTAWALLVPRAKAVGMHLFPWLALIVGTGCIGLLAMLARCLFLERRNNPV